MLRFSLLMLIRIDKNAPVPLHDQIKEQILGLIHAGRLRAGDQLPTMRALSIDLAVNFNTVAHAYRELDGQGVIATRRGEGTFVTNTPAEADMQQIRQNKLQSLVKSLFAEARRLGYSVAEVQQVVQQQREQAPEEK
jgi:GntR family transcriptional regulator